MTAFRLGIPFVKVNPTVLQGTADTDLQSRLHLPVEFRMSTEGLHRILTITACVDPICIQVMVGRRCCNGSGREQVFFRKSSEVPGCGSLQKQIQKNYT
jgi:hypothetical protein